MSFDLARYYEEESRQHMDVAEKTFNALQSEFEAVLSLCLKTTQSGGKIMFFGNGGSAADAQHLATELSVRFSQDRAPIAAIALTTDTSVLTAASNDMGFSKVFSRQIEALGKAGDTVIGISTSGTSENVLQGLKVAREMNINTAGFTGESGGNMKLVCDVLLCVPSPVTARIQEMHITLGQMLCGALEQALGLV